ncbi:MAG: hypothetical protein WCF98_12485 [Synechococcus sp. ELA057]
MSDLRAVSSGMDPGDPLDQLSEDDLWRICDALRYVARDLHHRSYAVTSERRQLLWGEMDQCLALADRLMASGPDAQPEGPVAEAMEADAGAVGD